MSNIFAILLIVAIVFAVKPELFSKIRPEWNLRRTHFIIIAAGFLILFGIFTPDEEVVDLPEIAATQSENVAEEEPNEPEPEPAPEPINYDVDGDLSLLVNGQTVTATITTDAYEGTLFEISLMSDYFDVLSEFVPAEGTGTVSHTFDIPESWGVTNIGGIAMIRFNVESTPQPAEVIEVYGENGKRMEGDIVEEINGNFVATYETDIIGYPTVDAVAEKNKEAMLTAFQALVDESNGVIMEVSTLYGDWDTVKVVISDDWYYTPEHEQERFVEAIGDGVEAIIKNTGVSNYASVYFYDSFNSRLASPRLFGGYKLD